MYVVYVWTGGWLISLVLVTSDNKGLLLLLLLLLLDVLEGRKLTSNNVAGSSHDPLQSFAVASGAVSKPGGDAAGQDALHSAGVEGSEDAGARSKLPQPSQEEERADVPSSALHLCEQTM